MVRENRYIVIKRTDFELLSVAEKAELEILLDKISLKRYDQKKKPLECVVVESDWPEYEPTWAAIEARVDAVTNE